MLVFLVTEYGIIRAERPLMRARLFVPFLYTAVTFVMTYMILTHASATKGECVPARPLGTQDRAATCPGCRVRPGWRPL